MTGPTQPDRPANSRITRLTAAILAATTIVAGAMLVRSPTPVVEAPACAAGQQLVAMRAQDTAIAEVIGDTLFVQRTDTLLRVDESTHQAFQITLDSGVAVQMAAMCAPVDSAFRIRIVPQLPSTAPAPQQVASALMSAPP